ncbi:phosphoglycerate mutase family protein [Rhizobium lemnae]|uniref:Histidine phosphatase family protein n=1 Tax=Rhizobium lemnae TaxID=1214924 RepID=A0ABV8E4J8_9HYPH|nr:histidine phosphatase family protein [Rhizobium lemnae]MCJ8508016.1 phosphoglycerate mutase family protein [Rhizobium lemnae]
MFGLYISHPQVQIDPQIPVPDWSLSPLGRERVFAVAARPWVTKLQRIISSPERKAIETAEILVEAAGVELEIASASREIDRSATGYLTHDAHEEAADRFFADPSRSFRGWEKAIDAQQRIVTTISQIILEHDPARPIVFVGHGGVGTLLKCALAGRSIARDWDQPAGGGNLFCFSLARNLAECRLKCEWTPMEFWQGET